MSEAFQVKRSHLKKAVESRDWDLLDLLLEMDASHIDDNNMFTDTWGEWWGMLLECVLRNKADGVRVLLKHGANRKLKSWGDCIPMSPLEAAEDKPALLELLRAKKRPEYRRKSEPELPLQESPRDRAVDAQGRVAEETGLVFQPEAFEDD